MLHFNTTPGKLEIPYLSTEYLVLVYVCLLDVSAILQILKLNSYTCSEMHLSLLLTPSSLSEHHTTPLVTLHFSLKPAECRCFYTDTEGGLMSRVSPLCNSMHYMLSLPSVSVQHLKRRFLFPGLPLCSVALRLVTTQAETDLLQPQTRLCVCVS